MPAPEQKASQTIDQMLTTAGWVIQDMIDFNLGAVQGVAVREFQTASGPADYVLRDDGVRYGDIVRAKHPRCQFNRLAGGEILSNLRSQAAFYGGCFAPTKSKFDPRKHHRRSIRLKGFDYTRPGAYFVTMVSYRRVCLFGEVVDGQARLNDLGKIVDRCWKNISRHFPEVELDVYVIMPNHLHGIIWIGDRGMGEASKDAEQEISHPLAIAQSRSASPINADASPQPPNGTQSGSLNAIVQNFKSVSTRKANQFLGSPGGKIWQRDYYERIVRSERELNAIRRYIENNPTQWESDRENPAFAWEKHRLKD
jgi:putative transposase